MKKSKRLLTILKLKEREEQNLAKQLSEITGLLNDEKNQLGELQKYRLEYQTEIENTVSQTMDMVTLLNRQRFVTKLDMVVDNQASKVEKLQGQWDQQVITWGNKKQEVNAWESMIEKEKKVEELARDKLVQKEMDDLYASRKRFD